MVVRGSVKNKSMSSARAAVLNVVSRIVIPLIVTSEWIHHRIGYKDRM